MRSVLTAKPGWQTTEFWIAFVPMALIVLTMLGVDVTAEDVSGWIYAAAGIVSAGYALGRSVVKAARANNPNTVIAEAGKTAAVVEAADPYVALEQQRLAQTVAAPRRVTTDV